MSFTELGRVAAGGELTAEKMYSFVDAASNLTVHAYYRVRQTDFDGAFSFSNVVVAEPGTRQEVPIGLTPNPTNGWLNVNNLPEGPISYRLLDLYGRELGRGILSDGIRLLNCNGLKAGAYILQFRSKDQALSARRFVKQ